MHQGGVVVSLEGDNAIVRIRRDSACGKCRACHFGSEQEELLIKIPNDLESLPGDSVGLGIGSEQLLKAAAIAYIIPLIALIAGVLAGYVGAGSFGVDAELSGTATGIALTLLSFLGIKAFEPIFSKGGNFTAKMISINRKYEEGDVENGN